MGKRLVVVEPFGNQELDNCHWIEEDGLAYLLVHGGTDDAVIPVPEYSEVELFAYQTRGYEVRDASEVGELQLEDDFDYPEITLDEWVQYTIEWYEQRGFVAVRIPMAGIISSL